MPLMCRAPSADTHKLAGQGMGTCAFRVFAPGDPDQLLIPWCRGFLQDLAFQ
jgi:hypothetical protein